MHLHFQCICIFNIFTFLCFCIISAISFSVQLCFQRVFSSLCLVFSLFSAFSVFLFFVQFHFQLKIFFYYIFICISMSICLFCAFDHNHGHGHCHDPCHVHGYCHCHGHGCGPANQWMFYILYLRKSDALLIDSSILAQLLWGFVWYWFEHWRRGEEGGREGAGCWVTGRFVRLESVEDWNLWQRWKLCDDNKTQGWSWIVEGRGKNSRDG